MSFWFSMLFVLIFAVPGYAKSYFCTQIKMSNPIVEPDAATVDPDIGEFMTVYSPGDLGFEVWENNVGINGGIKFDRKTNCKESKHFAGTHTTWLFECDDRSKKLSAQLDFDSATNSGSYFGNITKGKATTQFRFQFSNCKL